MACPLATSLRMQPSPLRGLARNRAPCGGSRRCARSPTSIDDPAERQATRRFGRRLVAEQVVHDLPRALVGMAENAGLATR